MEKNLLSLKINDIGIIVNPAAGAGKEFIESVASSAIEMFKESHVIRPPVGEGREGTIGASAELCSFVEELLAMEPIVTMTASLRKGDEIVVRGLKEGTCLIADGNPLAILGPDDTVWLHYIPVAASVLKLSL